MNSLRTIARSTAPQVGAQRRRFVDGLVNAKNELKATQELFQDPAKAHLHGADDPTYLKKGGDSMFFGAGMALFGVCSAMVLRGFWKMSHGNK